MDVTELPIKVAYIVARASVRWVIMRHCVNASSPTWYYIQTKIGMVTPNTMKREMTRPSFHG